MKMNPVVHFEMPAEDRNRMAEFYTKAFGWQMQMFDTEMGEYVVVTTTETDENRMIKKPGAINGGFYPKTANSFNQHPSIVVSVDDIAESMKKVEAAGGTVHGEPVDIPGIGKYVSIVDTEGNHVSMLQPNPRM